MKREKEREIELRAHLKVWKAFQYLKWVPIPYNLLMFVTDCEVHRPLTVVVEDSVIRLGRGAVFKLVHTPMTWRMPRD